MYSEFCSITLAAGWGSRMPADSPPKPCCKVGPVSVIENALRTFEDAGIHRHVVVVGYRAEEIMAEVCRRRPDVLFAFQPERRGTGDAVRCAMDLLNAASRPGHVLICAGDKVVEARAIRGMLEEYLASEHDLCVLAGPSEHYGYTGRLIVRDGGVQAVIEQADVQVRRLAAALQEMAPQERPQTVGEFLALSAGYIRRKAGPGKYLPALAGLVARPADTPLPWDAVQAAIAGLTDGFHMRSGRIELREAVEAHLCNLSVYAGRFDLLCRKVRDLRTNNVQRELYFTDVLDMMAADGHRVGLFRIDDPAEVMAFNTPAELEEVRLVHAVRTQKHVRYPAAEQWLNYLAWHGPAGPATTAMAGLAARAGRDRAAILVRSPGRINLLGRHVDHQGGRCNLMAINREVVIAAAPRDDDRINLWNADPGAYPDCSFAFGEMAADMAWEDWLRTLGTQHLRRMASGRGADWGHLVQGAAFRLQHRFRGRRLRGMDAFVCGEIPVAAGLSSSSALVVAAAEALAELNALNVHAREFVDLCGEGEWFVGTHGGSGDHAAIKLARSREVMAVSFFPFDVVGHHRFPHDCVLLVCHSGLPSDLGPEARTRLKARVACCHIAREIVRESRPALADRIEHLRDLNPERLDLSLPGLYALVKDIPCTMDARAIEALAGRRAAVRTAVEALDLRNGQFPVRDAALFIVSECARARMAADLLDRADAAALGQAMNVSHDGERVAAAPIRATDRYLDGLIARSARPESLVEAGVALWQQPGGYGCSTPQIDRMVDCARTQPGVLGAQLAGAGLGGCVMVLLKREAVEPTQQALAEGYYEPNGLEPRTFVCEPSGGSQVLTTVEAPPAAP